MKRKMIRNIVVLFLGVALVMVSGCTDTSYSEDTPDEGLEDVYDPEIDPANFVEEIDNQYLPLKHGTTFVYEGETEEGTERNEVFVSPQKKVIMGVTTTVVEDRVWENGELVEETYDWFAQDKDGNVWYFGEDSNDYEDGEIVSTAGSWEAGVNGAKPGIVMQASPEIGDIYYQEYYKGEAEDQAEVLSTTESVSVSYGSYDNCLVTREWTALEPGVEENKYYAPGIGVIKEEIVKGGTGGLELVEISTESESDSVINSADFTDPVDNSYFPLAVGTTFILEGESDGEDIRVEMSVTDQTKEILGVTTIVVREREWEDGELVEDTLDWYANDNEGNVWYFGEDSKEYDDGEVASTAGSWESGVDGAEPGILMKADPKVGDVYQQEYYEGEAEDMAEVLSLDESVSVEYGSFDNCLQTKEWTPLEPGVEENKFYASGVGLLLEVAVTEGNERLELVEIRTE